MNQFMKILVVILFGLWGWNGIQVFGALPEAEVSYTCLVGQSSSGVIQQMSLQSVKKNSECRYIQQSHRLWIMVPLQPQDFFVMNRLVNRNKYDRTVSFHFVNNCFLVYKIALLSEMSRKSACSPFHCVSIGGRYLVFAQRKLLI